MQTIKNVQLSAVEKFVYDHAGECADIVEGSLLDNMVFTFDFGTLFCFETYVNEWNSVYTLLFFHRDRPRGLNKAWERFERLQA